MRDFTFNNFLAESCCSSSNSSSKTGRNSVITSILMFFMGLIAFAQVPTVTSFSPTSAGVGQTVTITGTNFSSATVVSFGLIPATSFTIVNPTTITAVIGTGATGSVRVTNPSGFGQRPGFRFLAAPSCNLDGILKACLNDGNIQITATIEFSTPNPTLTYSFPVGPQNSTGASLVSTGPFIYDPINNIGTQVTVITPGTTGGQINYQLNVTNAGGTCECSKSITIVELELETFTNPILCNGGTTSIFADASSNGSSNFTFTLNPGNIVLGPHQDPSVEFTNIPAGDYTITVSDNNNCFKTTTVSVTEPPVRQITLNCPPDIELPACVSQEFINSEFANWLQTFNYSGGTNPVLEVSPSSPTAPLLCGTALQETISVTWTVTDDCNQREECTRTFKINRSAPVDVVGPDDITVSSCDYTSQAALQAAYDAWLAQFITIEDGCEGFASFGEGAQLGAPNLCQGGEVTLMYFISDDCSSDMVMSTFTVVPNTPVDVNGPSNLTASSCDYANQAALDAAYTAWVAQFTTVNDGCDAVASFGEGGSGRAPRLCAGGTVTLNYSIADNCSQDSASASFTITPSTPVDVNGPSNLTASSCDYTNQAALDAAYAAWVAQFTTVNDGCDASASFGQNGTGTAPRLCEGGTVTLTYSIADNCSQDSASASFTISPSTPVDVNGPSNLTASSCDYANQAALDAAYAAWVAQFTTVNDGCDASASFGQNDTGTAPRLCEGGTVTLTYSIADNCSQDSASASFTITPSTPVDVNGPSNLTASSCDYANQAALDAAYAAWVAQFTTVNDGCDASASFGQGGTGTAPRLCAGGTVTLTYSIADNCSQDSASASFTITPSTPVDVNGPSNLTASSCDYTNQAALDAAYAAWVAQFTTVNDGCDASASFGQGGTGIAPRLCAGGTVTLTYSIADNCSQDSASASFTITPSTPVDVNGPSNLTASNCDYANQAALDAAYAAWVAQFTTVNDGCDASASFGEGGTGTAPRLCEGGTVTLTYSIADNCSQDSASASFTITPSTPVDVNGPSNLTASNCDYANQAALNAAYAAWVAQFTTVNDGCDASASFGQNGAGTAPDYCLGGTVSLTYSIADNCSQDSVTASFTITPSAPVNVVGPADLTVNACDFADQDALNAAFSTWLNQFEVTSFGCRGRAVWCPTPRVAPLLCEGGTIELMYAITDACSADVVIASFTLIPSTPVDVNGPSNLTASSCDYANQAALDAAYAAWVAQFTTVNDGCDASASFGQGGTKTAPRLCEGGTVTLTYSIADNCSQDSASASFTITPSTPVDVNGPSNLTASSCDYANQAALDAAYAAWVAQFTTVNDGCDASASFGQGGTGTAPRLCAGGTVTLTYSIADNCSQDSASASFTITPAPAVDVNAPANSSTPSASYANQAAANAAFASWLTGFSVSGGCNPQGSYGQVTAPNYCGGTVTVTYTVTDKCYETSTEIRTFTIIGSNPVDVTGPSNLTASSCDYANQAALDAAYAAWLAQFVTVSSGNGATATFNQTPPTAPVLCQGGTVRLTYSISDNCTEDSVTASFTITPSTPVDVNGPSNLTASSCDYTNQAALDAAYAAWVAQFTTVNDGCDASASFGEGGTGTAPRLCEGGTVTLTYSIADNCSQDSASASFTITPSTPVDVNGPSNLTASNCDYANQAALNAAYAAWVAQFTTVNDGCDASASFGQNGAGTAPDYCLGGTVSLTYSIADNCSQDSVTASFTITPSAPVNVVGPADLTVNACDFADQDALNAAFSTWLNQFEVTSFGCRGRAVWCPTPRVAPLLCEGGTIELMYAITDACSADVVIASFTLIPSTPVDVNGPSNLTASSCDYANQAALDAAYAAWVAQFTTVNDGCDASASFGQGGTKTAPRLCEGGTVTLTYSIADNCSQDSASASFTITPSTPVDVNGPSNLTASSCDYANQAALDAAYAAWVAQFTTVNDGCDASASFGQGGAGTAPRLCAGGTVTLTYSIADNCSQDSASASFTITPSTPVDVNGPSNLTASSCDYTNQAALDAAYAAWVAQFTTVNDGCDASASFGQGGTGIAPRLCAGGTVTLTYSIADNCSQDSASASFTITPSTPVDVNGPSNLTASSCDYTNQAALDAAYAAWVAQFTTVNDGCDASASFGQGGAGTAPRLCAGGTVTLTYSIADNCSQDSASASFTITPSTPVDVNGPSNLTASSCDYTNQAALDAAYAAWVAQFTTVNDGCDASASFGEGGTGTAPRLCEGGTVTLTYSIADNCSQDSASASFTITPSTPVDVNGPSNLTASSCDYANQAALDAAYAAWVAQFTTVNDGCDASASFGEGGTGTAPRLCEGGTVTLTYSIADNCSQDSASASFTITPSTPVDVNGPSNLTASNCDYANQAALNAAYAAWVAQFTTVNDGCDASASFGQNGAGTAPDYCLGGTVSLTYSIADNCSQDSVTASFTITPSAPVNVVGPADLTVNACDFADQDALNAAFSTWLNQFEVTSFGCRGRAVWCPTPRVAPLLCEGGTIELMYAITDACSADVVIASFTLIPSTPVDVNGPSNLTASSCDYANQAALNAAYAAWVAQFTTVNDGCDASASFGQNGAGTAPDYCLGGTVSLTYSIADNCSQDSVTASFTITPSAPVNVVGPADLTVNACDFADQDALNAAFSTWLNQFEVTSFGCRGRAVWCPTPRVAPLLCEGGTIELMYAITDACSADVVMASFTLIPSTPVDVNGPSNLTASSCDYANQAALDAAYAAWVAQFTTVNDGCDASASFGQNGAGTAPRLCEGGTVTLTYSIADNCSQDSATASFTITPSTPVDVNGPSNLTASSCDYTNQAALDAAYAAWVAQFTTVNDGCDASASFGQGGTGTAPRLCEGGTVTLTYSIADNCSQDSASASFTITPSTPVDVNGPSNLTASSCDYANQAALDAAYAAWVAQFTTVNDGCDASASFGQNGTGTAPRLCEGGTVTLTYSIADNCSQDSVSASFTITASTPVDVNGPSNLTASSCDYANQAALDAAYAAWLAQFTTVNDGCDASASFGQGGTKTAPRLCEGGTVTLTYSIADNCSQDSASASFTITPAPQVNVNGPANSNNSACIYTNQTALNNAFSAWLVQFNATGGCAPTGSFQGGTPTAPVLCNGGTITVIYNVTDRCLNNTSSLTRTFTVTPAPAVHVTKPNDVCLSACTYANQSALNSAFAAWLAQFTATGGCAPTGSFQGGTPTAPVLCNGGTVTVTYNVTDRCFTTTRTATYIVTPPRAVTVNRPNDVCVNACNYTNQAALNTAFTNWLNCFTVSGGCAPTGSFQGGTPTAPTLCAGGVVTVTYVVTDKCFSRTFTRTFTVVAPSPVQVWSPNNITVSGCSYSSQSALNTAFHNWLCQFKVSGGCSPNGSFQGGTPTAPTLCAGGTRTVTYVVNDKCHSSTVTRTFTVTPSAVDVTGPSNYTASTCNFSSQAALDTAFNNWIAQFRVVNSGCNGQAYFSAAYCAPRLCQGGTISVTYNIKGNCNDDSFTARFTINPASNVVINRPADVTVTPCTYTSQSALNAAYTAWLNGFSVSGGCAPTGTFTTTPPTTAPSLCNGGTVCVSYRVVDVCFNATTFTRTFTVNRSSSVTVNRPNNDCVNACSFNNQAALNNAFNNWLNCFSVSGGCSAAGSFQGGRPTAPSLCTGGTRTVTYVVNTGCFSTTVTRTYTVNAPAPVHISAPNNTSVNASSYSSQSALNTAFNNWLCQFKVSGGCCPTGTIQGSPCAPSRSTGGTTTVTYVVNDRCHSSTITRTFTVTRNNTTARPAIVSTPTANITIKAYPNPYTATFGVAIDSSEEMIEETTVAITVYDMAGKLIEQNRISSSELSTMKFGDRYPSGVYNVVVTTGETIKTLRVIKR
jgi:hypothetical protein